MISDSRNEWEEPATTPERTKREVPARSYNGRMANELEDNKMLVVGTSR
jgi:hypothetical protein